eukprot:TRINITY_DN30610_c0_g1_i1.p1 TRINITY_DN30610_c0_g1~~TRINITY_DN30610_c0_g1_i1.p1  ORF type:complete len:1599 (-),score=371.85 TRINITY_DN30610_c0_g1_i1:40-4458(-)
MLDEDARLAALEAELRNHKADGVSRHSNHAQSGDEIAQLRWRIASAIRRRANELARSEFDAARQGLKGDLAFRQTRWGREIDDGTSRERYIERLREEETQLFAMQMQLVRQLSSPGEGTLAQLNALERVAAARAEIIARIEEVQQTEADPAESATGLQAEVTPFAPADVKPFAPSGGGRSDATDSGKDRSSEQIQAQRRQLEFVEEELRLQVDTAGQDTASAREALAQVEAMQARLHAQIQEQERVPSEADRFLLPEVAVAQRHRAELEVEVHEVDEEEQALKRLRDEEAQVLAEEKLLKTKSIGKGPGRAAGLAALSKAASKRRNLVAEIRHGEEELIEARQKVQESEFASAEQLQRQRDDLESEQSRISAREQAIDELHAQEERILAAEEELKVQVAGRSPGLGALKQLASQRRALALAMGTEEAQLAEAMRNTQDLETAIVAIEDLHTEDIAESRSVVHDPFDGTGPSIVAPRDESEIELQSREAEEREDALKLLHDDESQVSGTEVDESTAFLAGGSNGSLGLVQRPREEASWESQEAKLRELAIERLLRESAQLHSAEQALAYAKTLEDPGGKTKSAALARLASTQVEVASRLKTEEDELSEALESRNHLEETVHAAVAESSDHGVKGEVQILQELREEEAQLVAAEEELKTEAVAGELEKSTRLAAIASLADRRKRLGSKMHSEEQELSKGIQDDQQAVVLPTSRLDGAADMRSKVRRRREVQLDRALRDISDRELVLTQFRAKQAQIVSAEEELGRRLAAGSVGQTSSVVALERLASTRKQLEAEARVQEREVVQSNEKVQELRTELRLSEEQGRIETNEQVLELRKQGCIETNEQVLELRKQDRIETNEQVQELRTEQSDSQAGIGHEASGRRLSVGSGRVTDDSAFAQESRDAHAGRYDAVESVNRHATEEYDDGGPAAARREVRNHEEGESVVATQDASHVTSLGKTSMATHNGLEVAQGGLAEPMKDIMQRTEGSQPHLDESIDRHALEEAATRDAVIANKQAKAEEALAELWAEGARLSVAQKELLEEAIDPAGYGASPATVATLSRMAHAQADVEDRVQQVELEFAEANDELAASRQEGQDPEIDDIIEENVAAAAKAADAAEKAVQRAIALDARSKELSAQKRAFLRGLDPTSARALRDLEEAERKEVAVIRNQMRSDELELVALAAIEREHLLQKNRSALRAQILAFEEYADSIDAPRRAQRVQRAQAALERLGSINRGPGLAKCVQAARAAGSAERMQLAQVWELVVITSGSAEAVDSKAVAQKNAVVRELQSAFDGALRDVNDSRNDLEALEITLLRPSDAQLEATSKAINAATAAAERQADNPEKTKALADQYVKALEAEAKHFSTALVQTAAGPAWGRWPAAPNATIHDPSKATIGGRRLSLVERDFWDQVAEQDLSSGAGEPAFWLGRDVTGLEPPLPQTKVDAARSAADFLAAKVTASLIKSQASGSASPE